MRPRFCPEFALIGDAFPHPLLQIPLERYTGRAHSEAAPMSEDLTDRAPYR